MSPETGLKFSFGQFFIKYLTSMFPPETADCSLSYIYSSVMCPSSQYSVSDLLVLGEKYR